MRETVVVLLDLDLTTVVTTARDPKRVVYRNLLKSLKSIPHYRTNIAICTHRGTHCYFSKDGMTPPWALKIYQSNIQRCVSGSEVLTISSALELIKETMGIDKFLAVSTVNDVNPGKRSGYYYKEYTYNLEQEVLAALEVVVDRIMSKRHLTDEQKNYQLTHDLYGLLLRQKIYQEMHQEFFTVNDRQAKHPNCPDCQFTLRQEGKYKQYKSLVKLICEENTQAEKIIIKIFDDDARNLASARKFLVNRELPKHVVLELFKVCYDSVEGWQVPEHFDTVYKKSIPRFLVKLKFSLQIFGMLVTHRDSLNRLRQQNPYQYYNIIKVLVGYIKTLSAGQLGLMRVILEHYEILPKISTNSNNVFSLTKGQRADATTEELEPLLIGYRSL